MTIDKQTKLTGGLTSHYLAEVKHPQRKGQLPYVAEMEDISHALQFTPEEFNIVKAIWRAAAERLGYGKPNYDPIYDAEKVVHYAVRRHRLMTQAAEDSKSTTQPVVEVSTEWINRKAGDPVPNIPPGAVVELDLGRCGVISLHASDVIWGSDVGRWRRIK